MALVRSAITAMPPPESAVLRRLHARGLREVEGVDADPVARRPRWCPHLEGCVREHRNGAGQPLDALGNDPAIAVEAVDEELDARGRLAPLAHDLSGQIDLVALLERRPRDIEVPLPRGKMRRQG